MTDDPFDSERTQGQILDLLAAAERPLKIAEIARRLSAPVPGHVAADVGRLAGAGKVRATAQGKIDAYEIVVR